MVTAVARNASATTKKSRTGGRLNPTERRKRLDTWANFINDELAARDMRPAQLAAYTNVNASTVSTWRNRKSLPDRAGVFGVARCLRLPVSLVAEKAGMILDDSEESRSRLSSDPEWRALQADIELLSEEKYQQLKAALRHALQNFGKRPA